MTLNQLISSMRSSMSLSQKYVASRSGISQVALSRFESGDTKLLRSALREILPILSLNNDFFEGYHSNPFKSDKLIKLYLPENKFTGSLDFSLIYFIVEANAKLDIIFLSPGLTSLNRTIFEKPIYVIAIKDSDNNIFLFRRQTMSVNKAAIVGEKELRVNLSKIKNKQQKHIKIKTSVMDKNLKIKVRNWSVEKEDVTPLFADIPSIYTLDLTAEEKDIIKNLRENKICIVSDPDEMALLQQYRENNIYEKERIRYGL